MSKSESQLLISSLESLGTLDGPGIRTVFFLQGCPLRCAYCHNPETQSTSYLNVAPKDRHHYCPAHSDDGPAGWMNFEKLLSIAKRYKPYHGKKGGLTFSGGECLVQAKTLLEFFPKLKEANFNLCLDTSGYGARDDILKLLLPYVDHIILDIKAHDDESYKSVCKVPIVGLKRFIKIASEDAYFKGKITLRHVCVPGLTDDIETIPALVDLAISLRNKVENLEVLPYHNHGVPKYEALGLEYSLNNVAEMDIDEAQHFEKLWRQEWADRLSEINLGSQATDEVATLKPSIIDHFDSKTDKNDKRTFYNKEIGAELGGK